MRRVIMVCDRCHKEYKPDAKERRNRFYTVETLEGDELDLCPQCYERLRFLLDNSAE